MAFWHLDAIRQRHAGKTCRPILPVQFPALAATVHLDKGMMHDLRIGGLKLDSFHVTLALQWHWHNEVAIYILPFAGQVVTFGQFQNQVRFPEHPTVRPLRPWWQVRGLPLECSFAAPLPKHGNFRLAQAPLASEVAIPWLRQPRRHITPRRHVRNESRMLPGILVGEQWERSRLSKAMADGAMLKQDWGNVFVEGYRCSIGSEKSCQRQGGKNGNRLHRQAYTEFGRWCRAEGASSMSKSKRSAITLRK